MQRPSLNRILANKLPKKVGGIMLAHLLTDRRHDRHRIHHHQTGRGPVLSSVLDQRRDARLGSPDKPAPRGGEKVSVENVTEKRGVLVVAGPKSRDLLQGLTHADLSNAGFRWLTAQEIDVAGVPVRAMRVNYVGELGWELHAPCEHMAALYAKVWEAGAAHGAANVGLYAVNSMRHGKGLPGLGRRADQ